VTNHRAGIATLALFSMFTLGGRAPVAAGERRHARRRRAGMAAHHAPRRNVHVVLVHRRRPLHADRIGVGADEHGISVGLAVTSHNATPATAT